MNLRTSQLLLVGVLTAVSMSLGCIAAKKRGSSGLEQTPSRVEAEAYPLTEVKKRTLSNGLRVLVLEDHFLPVATATLMFETGSAADPKDAAGLTNLTLSILEKGTESRSAQEIAETIDSFGGSLESSVEEDSSTLSVKVLKKDFSVALDLLHDVATAPTFPKPELEILRKQALGNVRARFDAPKEIATYHARYLVYGEEHPYGFSPSERSLSEISVEDLKNQYDRVVAPQNGWLLVAGDVEADEVFAQVTEAFGSWEKKDSVADVDLPDIPDSKRHVRLVNNPNLSQSTIMIAHPGIRRAAEDRHAVNLMNYTLGGGGFASRLMKVVRSKGGKTYGIGSRFSSHGQGGLFYVRTATRSAETVETIDLALGEIEAVKTQGVKGKEVHRAKGNFVGAYPLDLETVDAVGSAVLDAELYDLGLDAVREYPVRVATTPRKNVNAAAREHLRPGKAVIVVVGNANQVRKPLEERFGEVEVVPYESYAHAVDQ